MAATSISGKMLKQFVICHWSLAKLDTISRLSERLVNDK